MVTSNPVQSCARCLGRSYEEIQTKNNKNQVIDSRSSESKGNCSENDEAIIITILFKKIRDLVEICRPQEAATSVPQQQSRNTFTTRVPKPKNRKRVKTKGAETPNHHISQQCVVDYFLDHIQDKLWRKPLQHCTT